MHYQEEHEYLKGLSNILRNQDIEKVKLNLEELLEYCICNDSLENIVIMQGLNSNPKEVEALRKKLITGSILTNEALKKAAKLI